MDLKFGLICTLAAVFHWKIPGCFNYFDIKCLIKQYKRYRVIPQLPPTVANLVLKYGTDVVSNLQTVVWLGLPESFVHNLALSFAHKPSSKVCPMSFHLERHFCLILNWNFTWNDIFLHIFLVNDSIRLFANSENNETLLYDISHLLLLPAP